MTPSRTVGLTLALTTLLAWPGAATFLSRLDPAKSAADAPTERKRGVCLFAGRELPADAFDRLAAAHVDWISQTPFGWQRSYDDPEFELATSGHVFWGETDGGLAETARAARAHGIRTMLKPHVWLMDMSGGHWVGSIRMKSEADWRRWFACYERFIVHYAQLARASGMDALCVGTELEGTSDREADWRRVIAAVRRVYPGPLTYAANWSSEFERVRFWDALDFIGVQAYFPLSG